MLGVIINRARNELARQTYHFFTLSIKWSPNHKFGIQKYNIYITRKAEVEFSNREADFLFISGHMQPMGSAINI